MPKLGIMGRFLKSFRISSSIVFMFHQDLICFELFLNTYFFFLFTNKLKRIFLAVFLSIVLSKTAYYLLKFILIQFGVLDKGLVSTALTIQLITVLVFSMYLYLFYKKERSTSDKQQLSKRSAIKHLGILIHSIKEILLF